MPLRDDLLVPIQGGNPSGPDLKYDKVFDQLKEARIEEDDSLPSGQWGRAPKKADRVLVIKVAGETLAKRTKDLRVAGWYVESLVRREGFSQLAGSLALIRSLQETFWQTIHPVLDEDGNADLRIGAVEAGLSLLATSVKGVPLTRNGFDVVQYGDARALGFEADEMSDDKRAARADAVARGRLTADDAQRAVDGTPKAFYADVATALTQSAELLDELDLFHEERYGSDYPSLGKLKAAVEDVRKVVNSVLAEKRRTEPDAAVLGADEQEAFVEDEPSGVIEHVEEPVLVAASAGSKTRAPVGIPTDEASAYAQIAAAAEFLRTLDSGSPVPYLLCSALRLGEARGAGFSDSNFPVAPPTQTRQALRRLANEANWDELMQLCLRTMTEPCGRVWLDLQRYAWRAASESWNGGVAKAIAGTVRALLTDVPEIRGMMMDDDTPAANAETLQWIDAEVMPSLPEVQAEHRDEEPEQPEYEIAVSSSETHGENSAPDIYDAAVEVLKRGRVGEAINMLIRNSEQQPSGRARFQRRVQMAQLCLAANQSAVAYPVLRDLSSEMERRCLETWEASEMLSLPLSLLLKCLNQRNASEEDKEILFERLCRLDPQAALTVRT